MPLAGYLFTNTSTVVYADTYRPRDTGVAMELALTSESIQHSGTTYSGWTDLSGHERSPSVTAGTPTVNTSGAAPCVVFDGSTWLDGAIACADQPLTMFIVRSNDDVAAAGRKWVWDTTDTGAAGRTNSFLNLFSSASARQDEVGDDASASTTTTTNLEVVRVDWNTTHRHFFVNGVWKQSNAVPTTTVRTLTAYRIGNRIGGGFPWAGKIYTILVYSGEMSEREKRRIENDLISKYGLTAPFSWPLSDVALAADPRFVLPPVMHAIVNRTIRIQEHSVHYHTGRDASLVMTCDLERERAPMGTWQFTPSVAGDYTLTVTEGAYNTSTTIRAINMLGAVTKKWILCVGDSRTNRGGQGWIQYLGDLLTSARAGFVGTVGPQAGYSYKYEGVDSKAWSHFDSTDQKFYFGGVIDIPHYISLLTNTPDIILWSLGQNDVYGQNDGTIEAAIDTCFGHIDNLLAAWTAAVPTIKHFLAYNWPLSTSPTPFGGASTRDAKRRMVHRYVERLYAEYGGREAEGIYLAPRTYFEVDSARDFESDGIHETRSMGHNALAEAYLAALVAYGWT